MAAMVNGTESLPRNFRNREKKGLFRSFRKKISSRPPIPSKFTEAGQNGKEDEFVVNRLAMDDFDCDYRDNADGEAASRGSVGSAEASQQSELKYAAIAGGVPPKLVPRRDEDVFRAGERSPRRSLVPRASVTSSASAYDMSPVASIGSEDSSHAGSRSTIVLSPSPVQNGEHDGGETTPTRDLVDNSLLIEYERYLFVRASLQSAWQMEDAFNVCMQKSLEDAALDNNGTPLPPDAVMTAGELSSTGEVTVEERYPPPESAYGSSLSQRSADDFGENVVMNSYKDAKRMSALRRSPLPAASESEDERILSPQRTSTPIMPSSESMELKKKTGFDRVLRPQSKSVPNSPSLVDRRSAGKHSKPQLHQYGTLTLSNQSLDKPRLIASHCLSSSSLSNASSVSSLTSVGSGGSDDAAPSVRPHRRVTRVSTGLASTRRVSTSDIRSTPTDSGGTPPFRQRAHTMGPRRKKGLELSISDTTTGTGHSIGRIVRPGGHVRVKSTTKMNSVGNDDSDVSLSSRPVSRFSVPASPFSPLLSPSPLSKFLDNVGDSSCLYSPTTISPQWMVEFSVEKRQIEFVLPMKSSIRIMCSGGRSVSQVKALLWAKMSDEGILISYPKLKDMSLYSLKYCYNDNKCELFDELQMMQTLNVWQTWKKHGMRVGTLIVELRREPQAKEKRLVAAISHLIGGGLTQYLQRSTPEIDWARRSLVGVRLAAVRSRDHRLYSMEAEVTTSTIPGHIKEIFSTGSGMLNLEVFFMAEPQSKEIKVPISVKPVEIMADMFHHFKAEAEGHNSNSSAGDFVLQVCGQHVFIHGDHLFVNFTYVRECLSKRLPIKLALVPVLDTEEDEPETFGDEEFVDESLGVSANHNQLTVLNKPHGEVFIMSMWDIAQNFRLRILGLSRLTAGLLGRGERIGVVYVEAGIYHGGKALIPHQQTAELPYRSNPQWYQWIEFNIPTCHLPKAARICWSVMMTVVTNRGRQVRGPVPMYWVNMNIIDHRSLLQQGNIALSMWPCGNRGRENSILAAETFTDGGGGGGGGVDMEDGRRSSMLALDGSEASECGMQPTGSSAVNSQSFDCPTLNVELDTYAHPVAIPSSGAQCTLPQSPSDPPPGNVEQLDKVISSSTIVEMTADDKKLIFHNREFLSRNPKALVKFLGSMDWADLQQVQEAHRLIAKWKKISPEDALELLDFQFADESVRSLAVSCLETLSNTELVSYLLQLVQVLKFESYHDSALARFLLKRALNSKHIGHFFFWYLRAEMDRPDFRQRYSLLLEAYLRGCGRAMLIQFQKQNAAVIGLNEVARRVKFAESRSEHAPPLATLLAEANLPLGFAPAFNCSIVLGKLDLNACKVMTSKKKPLWLEFATEDVGNCSRLTKQVIFKQGDDLRQDMLTLQVLRLMDLLWQNDGLDLYMIPYGCVATGLNSGMIEVVDNAQTIAKIQQEQGGGVLLPKGFAPFKKETVFNWLKRMNPGQEDLDKAVERFTLSCAGYCVATYVLGIGDRHNDNIMLKTNGNLFHIDFGHFLGNIKYFNVLGKKVKRERLPFILTPDFIYVMNSNKDNELFPLFQRTCARAFNILRRHANVLINLFAMMKLTGIPELRGTEDLTYLHHVLRPNSTDSEAEQWFYSLIDECRANSDSVQANWALHIIGQQLAKT